MMSKMSVRARSGRFVGSVALAALAMGAASQAQAAEICFRTAGPTCRNLESLREGGVDFFKILPGSMTRTSTTVSWKLLGYDAEQILGDDPVSVTAVVTGQFFGENQVLAVQEAVCEASRAAGLACARDYLEGTWNTYGLDGNARPYTARFESEATTDLTSSGTFETRRFSCQSGEGDALREVEVVCKGSYNTSLRLFYLLNNSTASLSNVDCSAGETRAAIASTASLPVCDASGEYAAQNWLPFGQQPLRYRFVNYARILLEQQSTALYFQGL